MDVASEEGLEPLRIGNDRMPVIGHHAKGMYLNVILFSGDSDAIEKDLVDGFTGRQEEAALYASSGNKFSCFCKYGSWFHIGISDPL